MEWCLDCHRNPAKYLRPASEIYNNAWEKPASDKPVWCAVGDENTGVPTAQSVSCVTNEPVKAGVEMASLQMMTPGATYQKFTSQDELGHFLLDHYKIRKPNELDSCEVCHR
jgi:hypothetical protein